ncbi:MAG TPA: zf-HC2 domain-containing protein [Bryobacteraceae bacterium]|nr:zf-HC2 domain-containing protein [Bryobacteraceae bacterium]
MLTCKQFLQELNDFLDETTDQDMKLRLQKHVNECPNCFVIVDTTRRTLEVYKGMEPQAIPENVKTRLWAALEKKMAARKPPSSTV